MGAILSAFLIVEKGKRVAAWYGIRPKQTVPEILAASNAG